jgi:hypothetical protein
VDDAPEVHVDHPSPLVERLVAHEVEGRHAGVVAQDVHLPEDLLGLVRRSRERRAGVAPAGRRF